MILSGEHRPGAKLVQDRLAKQLGVSRGVVREALMEMKAFGLIETNDNRGASVTHISERGVLDCLDVREMMEGLAARLCSQRINREQLRQLQEMVQRICDLSTSGRYDEAVWLDRGFHLRQIELSGNTMLTRLAENHWLVGKFLTSEYRGDAARTRDEHTAILRAIEAGDEAEAERLARGHIRFVRTSTEQRIANGTFSPRWLVPNKGGADGAVNEKRFNQNP